jgi:hypothetical protein
MAHDGTRESRATGSTRPMNRRAGKLHGPAYGRSWGYRTLSKSQRWSRPPPLATSLTLISSIKFGASSLARELFTRFDTSHRCSTSSEAGFARKLQRLILRRSACRSSWTARHFALRLEIDHHLEHFGRRRVGRSRCAQSCRMLPICSFFGFVRLISRVSSCYSFKI